MASDGDPLVTALIAKGLIELGKHVLMAAGRADQTRAFVLGEVAKSGEVDRALSLAAQALTEVPAIDPELGGEDLRDFLRSPEARQLVKEIYVWRLAEGDHRALDAVR